MISSEVKQDNFGAKDEPAQIISACVCCVDQCVQLLELISTAAYVDCSVSSSSVGSHIRHILERFQSLFNGLPDGTVDYDSRRRDKSVENELSAGLIALASLKQDLETAQLRTALADRVMVRESLHPQSPQVTIASTVERELMSLLTHSIHHLAIIALLLKPYGYQLDKDFGKAPSTIIYERS